MSIARPVRRSPVHRRFGGTGGPRRNPGWAGHNPKRPPQASSAALPSLLSSCELRLLLLLLVLVFGGPLAALESWYVGDMAGAPSVSLRVVETDAATGRRTDTDMVLMIGRRMGPLSSAMTIRQATSSVFDLQGRLLTMRLDEDQSGRRTVADLRVERDDAGTETAIGEIRASGRATPVRITLKPGERLGDDRDLQRSLSSLPTGATIAAVGLGLVSGRVLAVRSQGTITARTADRITATVIPDIVPVPMQVAVAADGTLLTLSMDLGFLRLDLRQAPGPVALRPAEINPSAIVSHQGPAPTGMEVQRYRLPKPEAIARGPFQDITGDVVTVRTTATAPAPDPSWLVAEPRLESDAPELVAWVAANRGHAKDRSAALAEHLRDAVRAHITAKGLDQADAGALDTLRSRTGDCTEHAHLLCAVLRAAGIPARVQIGVVYATDYGGWVGHAWVEGYTVAEPDGQQWRLLDAAYPGIPRTRYLALAEISGPDGGTGRVAAALVRLAGGAISTAP